MDLNAISTNPLIGQSLPLVASAARSFIENYSSEINDEVNINFYINDVITRAKSEIDAGRPTILAGTLENIDINHNSHVVVAYGYATYNGEEGFIVHSGWEGYSANVWYPASWFGFQLTMSVDHVHDFYNDFNVYDNAYRMLECKTCDCIDLDYIYDVSSDGTTITGTNYTFYGEVTLPKKISGIIINSIGNEAFSNQINLTSITINENITTIGDNAFDGCTSLSKVYINDINNGTNINVIQIGDDVFNNCSSTLKIITTQRSYGAYINSNCWGEYINCIEPNVIFDVINLNCKIGDTNFIMIENKKIIKLIVECNCYYTFINKSKGKVILYNESAVQITSNTMTLIFPLEKGIYYLEPINGGTNLNDEFQVDFRIYNYDIKEVTNNAVNNISSNIHLTSDGIKHGFYFYNHELGSGFYNFKVNAGSSNLYPEGAISIYSDIDCTQLIDRYNLNDLTLDATSKLNENEIYVFLPNNGNYYINVILYNQDYSNVTLTIENVYSNEYDYTNRMLNSGFCIVFENIQKTSYFEKVTFNQYVKIEMDIFTNINLNSLGEIYIFKEVKVPIDTNGAYDYALETIHISQIGSPDWLAVFTLILEPGTYYFGYDNNLNKTSVNFAFNRIIQYEECNKNILVADPKDNAGYVLGTEVLFNKGVLNGNTITQGFTRNIYLNVEDRVHDPMSRLEYSWCSSNENAAIVTSFGTVLALPVDDNTNVTIYAIRKSDPSVIYSKTFTILNYTAADFIKIEINLSYSYSRNNGTYKLELNSTNCPFPMIQYYIWDDFELENKTVTVGDWGHITSNGVFEALIVGTYKLNPRVTLYINLNITE